MHLGKRAIAEFLGTFWLTFGGCGAAVIAAGLSATGYRLPRRRAGLRPHRGDDGLCRWVYFRRPFQPGDHDQAFGLQGGSPLAMSFPTLSSRSPARSPLRQCSVTEGHPGFVLGGFASNGFGDLRPGHYNLLSCAILETVLSFFFMLVIIWGRPSAGASSGFAPLAIGLTLTLIHLISIPVTNTSVNPARSTGPAIFAGKAYIDQLWFFWAAPISGALVAGVFGGLFFRKPD